MVELTSCSGDFVGNQHLRARDNGAPLPAGLRWAIEMLSGYDMSEVRVYYASDTPGRVGARALARGTDIHVQAGAEDALPHEAWHVVQQMQGRVEARFDVNGVSINDDPALEREADVMGAMASALSISGMWKKAKGVLAKVRIKKPVVQRIVTIGDNTILTAAAIRDKLENFYEITAANTPSLTTIIDDMLDKKRSFPDLLTLKNEVKRRSFGLRHVAASEALLQRQDTARQTYLTDYNHSSDQLYAKIKKIIESGLNQVAKFERKLPAPLTFIRWAHATSISRARINPPARETPFYKWLANPANVTPLAMNCFENVIYAGAWTDNGARTALYSRDYVLWAEIEQDVKVASFADPAADKMKVPRFVKYIIENAVQSATCRDSEGRRRKLPAPESVEAGNIVVFNSGAHVALVTGKKRDVSTREAANEYGAQGHEIIELDGWTGWMVKNTIQDCIAFGGYNSEWHVGNLPEITAQEMVEVRENNNNLLLQANLPVTRFYS